MAGDKLTRYRTLDYPLPDTTLVWQLSDAGLENFHLVEIPRREPGPDDIEYRVDTNSICFSDVKVVRQGPTHPRLAGYDMARDKVVLGHEISITVTARGPGSPSTSSSRTSRTWLSTTAEQSISSSPAPVARRVAVAKPLELVSIEGSAKVPRPAEVGRVVKLTISTCLLRLPAVS